MSKCGCSGSTCSCKIVGGNGVVVTGAGSAANPYVIQTGTAFGVVDTPTVDLTLLGNGSTSAPWQLSAALTAGLDDLVDVDTSGGTTGEVLARQADGTYALVPPATASPGLIATDTSLEGDGSSGDPLDVRLGTLSGLTKAASGLKISPYTVSSEANLDSTYGALPVGSIVAKSDGTTAWMKTSSGWITVFEDSGTISTVSGNIVAESGWTCNNLSMRRRNGFVQFYATFTPAVAVAYNNDGNITNELVGNVVGADYRPAFDGPLLLGGRAGHLAAGEITAGGNINIGALHAELPAGVAISFMGTWIGA